MNHYRISEIKTEIDEPIDVLPSKVAKKCGLKPGDIAKWEIRRKSIDSRRKPDIKWVYTVDFWCEKYIETKGAKGKRSSVAPVSLQLVDDARDVMAGTERPAEPGMIDMDGKSAIGEAKLRGIEGEPVNDKAKLVGRAVVVGMGPCGIFAALELAKRGCKPLVLERGPAMDGRVEAVENFRKHHVLNPEANMLYGEGGAGTFSDGKLGTGIKDGHIRDVLRTFADAGAGEDITYLAKPHIGTDVLRTTIVNLRNQIIELGGEVRFNCKLDSFDIKDGSLQAITVTDTLSGAKECIETNALILAIGHSARDTFAVLNRSGFDMEQKAFSIGVRMEHPQSLIDQAQYGAAAIEKYGELLPAADYKISTTASNGRGVYSFCMCPGGEVVVCTTKDGELCVNGMSNRNRDSGTANSGILCTVNTEDYNNGDPSDVLAGVRYQEKYEKLAYENGGGNFSAPSARMEDFLNGQAPQIDNSLPDFAASALKDAVPEFARKIKGYNNPDALVTAVETRSSSPVRIIRDDCGESNIKGVFPAGEGAGYAGGITSAACDGIRAANRLIDRFTKLY